MVLSRQQHAYRVKREGGFYVLRRRGVKIAQAASVRQLSAAYRELIAEAARRQVRTIRQRGARMANWYDALREELYVKR